MVQRFFSIILRWIWLIVLATVLAMLVTYWFSKDKPPTYQARSLLIVGPGIDSPNPDLNTLKAGSQLMLTYAEMPTTEPFLKAIIDTLGLNMDINALRDMIAIKANPETQVVSVIVTNEDPNLAVAIANQTADNLVELSPSGATNPFDPSRDQVRQQAGLIEASILDTKARIAQIGEDLKIVNSLEAQSTTGTSSEIVDPEQQLEQLEAEYQAAITDSDSKRQISLKILQSYLLPNTNARIKKLEDELKQIGNVNIQRLIIDQLTKERSHLSDLQNVIVETQRLIGGQTLETQLVNSEASVKLVEDELLQPFIDIETRRLLISELAADRDILNGFRQVALEREQAFMQQIAQERNRISEMQAYRVESRGVLTDQLDQERKSLDDSYNTVALLYTQLEKATTNQVKIIERANNAEVVGLSLWLLVALSGVTGLVLSGVIILAIEFFSDGVQTPANLVQVTGRPVLGSVEMVRFFGRAKRDSLIIEKQPDSAAAESYRLVGTKLLFANNSTSPDSALLVPTLSTEDATEVAANLAIALAQAGHRTVLVDANLHQPRIHELFDIAGSEGLSDFLVSPKKKPQLVTLDRHPGLCVLPAGTVSGLPFELLSTARIVDLLTYLHLKADILLISAPSPAYAETLFLALRVSGVILIVNTSQTSQAAVKKAQESLQSVGVQLNSSILCDNNHIQVFSRRNLDHLSGVLRRKFVKAKPDLPLATPSPKDINPFSKLQP